MNGEQHGMGHPWRGIPIAPWMPEFYGPERPKLGGSTRYTFGAAPTGQSERLVGVTVAEGLGPVVWEIHLRLEDTTNSGFAYPIGRYFQASFGCQSGTITVYLSYGTQAVMGDALWIVGPTPAQLTAVGAPDTKAVAFAVPNPGGQPGWHEV